MINVMYIVFLAMLSLAVSFDDGTDEVTEEAGQEEIAGLTNDSIQEEQPLSSRVFVIPTSRNVMRGSKFEAQIVLAEIDTLHDPQIYIDGKPFDTQAKGYFSARATREGIQTLKGYVEVVNDKGENEHLPFETSYFVSEPMATVSNTMMNVMYAGIDNPVSISVPGIASSQISASMTNGTLTRQGGGWVARPTKVDQDAVISVSATQDGRSMRVSEMAVCLTLRHI